MLLVAGIFLFVDPNDYKKELSSQVEKATGRTLQIPGDLKLTVFPSVGITASSVSLSNPKGFDSNDFVSIEHFTVQVKVRPLFDGSVEIDAISLDRPEVNLVVGKNGSNNWQDLFGKKIPGNKKPADAATHKAVGSLFIKSVVVRDGKITYRGVSSAEDIVVEELNFSTSEFRLGENMPLELAFKISSEIIPGNSANIVLATTLKANLEDKIIDLTEVSLDAELADLMGKLGVNSAAVSLDSGNATVRSLKLAISGTVGSYDLAVPAISITEHGSLITVNEFDLNADGMDVKGQLALEIGKRIKLDYAVSLDKLEIEEGGSTDSDANQPSDTSPLQAIGLVDTKGTVLIKNLIYQGLELSDIQIVSESNNRGIRLESLAGGIASGTMQVSGSLLNKDPEWELLLNAKLKSIQVDQILKAVADFDQVHGEVNATAELTSSAEDIGELAQGLDGDITFLATDGELKGVDIQQSLIDLSNLTGYRDRRSDIARPNASTKFAELSADFVVADSVFKTDNLKMKAPVFRVDGAGEFRLNDDAIDFSTTVSVVDSLEGQGGKELGDLAGVSIPLKIKGPTQSLSYSVDVSKLLKSELDNKLDEELNKKLGLTNESSDEATRPLTKKERRKLRKEKLEQLLLKKIAE